ncbi:hypothetical protein EV385_2296 [Krasilnikovia cinnamomea]|uniref:Uncharacterized protein n=1 Tax=Krasilnikovia cinnamomea TaxID=349313 RepID=A0A4Q7ZJ52_9ACTN|nr:hypothetical protein EV385_2296 [Krasilnikovia cinnamomea]
MTEAANWRDVKVKARAVDPSWDTEERGERRRQMRERMLATGLSQARIGNL